MFCKSHIKATWKVALGFYVLQVYWGECYCMYITYMYMYNHGDYSEMLVRSWPMKVTRLELQSPQHRQKSYHRSVSHTCSITMHALLSIESKMYSHQYFWFPDCEEEHNREHCPHSDIGEAPVWAETLPTAQGSTALPQGTHAGQSLVVIFC